MLVPFLGSDLLFGSAEVVEIGRGGGAGDRGGVHAPDASGCDE